MRAGGVDGVVLGVAADGVRADAAHRHLSARAGVALRRTAVHAAHDVRDARRAAASRGRDVLRARRRRRIDRARERDRRSAVVDVDRLANARRNARRIARAQRQRQRALAIPARVDRLADRRRRALMPGRDVLRGRRGVDQLPIEASPTANTVLTASRPDATNGHVPLIHPDRLPKPARRAEARAARLTDVKRERSDCQLRGLACRCPCRTRAASRSSSMETGRPSPGCPASGRCVCGSAARPVETAAVVGAVVHSGRRRADSLSRRRARARRASWSASGPSGLWSSSRC